MRDRTYFPKLCLIQLAGEARHAAVDPLAPEHRSRAAVRAAGRSGGAQGVPRRAPGHRDFPSADRAGALALVRHPARGDGLRLWRGGRLRDAGRPAHQGADRQELALHRLVQAAAQPAAAELRARRRDPSARGLPEARAEARRYRAQRLGRPGAGRADQPRDLPAGARGRLAADQAALARPALSRHRPGARRVARADRAGARPAAQPGAARRLAARGRRQPPDLAGRARQDAAHQPRPAERRRGGRGGRGGARDPAGRAAAGSSRRPSRSAASAR